VGPITNLTGADLQVEEAEFRPHRVVYKYIPPDSCALAERCVGGPGWRRLLQFSTADRNTGGKNLEIGLVDYFIDGGGTPLSDHHIFEYSACHHHYHFTHYGEFSFGGDEATTVKRGFCLQSTGRFSNNEVSPLHNPYGDCHFQGIAAGWVDQYKIGLDCQWIDVTAVDTSQGPVTRSLRFTSNPDGFLCEGTPVLDAQGNPVFEPTEFRTDAGETVDRPGCNFAAEWSANNTAMYDVTLPPDGESSVTAPCLTGRLGPLRNCGFATPADPMSCAPGSSVSLRCTIAAGAAPQVTRVCEWSAVLGIGIPCTYEASLVTATVGEEGTDVRFACPPARSATEPGGSYAVFTAPVFEEDALAPVSCTPR
jgi:hypothetical protein